MTDPARRCMPLAEWSADDQRRWAAALQRGTEVLDDDGAAAHLAPTTRRRLTQAYGRWLTFLARSDGDDRFAPEQVPAYIAEMQSQGVASSTLHARIRDLVAALRAMGREAPSCLSQAQRRLQARVTPHRDKAVRLQSSATLFDLGVQQMQDALAYAGRGAKRPATQYRDGLTIALLAACPLRLSNLTAIRIGTHLVPVDEDYWLRFDAAEMKARRSFEMPLPPGLTRWIDLYLSRYRPVLLGAGRSDRLWISTGGQGIAAGTLHDNICRITERAFGQRVNPHLFRDCLATSVALDDPVHVRISAPLLGHASLATTNRHYNQATMAEAMLRHQDNIRALRHSLSSQEIQ